MASIRSFGFERIGALSDGVCAIALTLLVLEIKIPEEAASEATLWLNLMNNGPELVAWIISFIIISVVWYDQHYLFSHGRKTDSMFIIINMLQLGAISLIPLAAHLIGRFPEDALSSLVFSAVMLLTGLLMAASAGYLAQHAELHGSADARFLSRRASYHCVSFTLTALLAVLLTAHHPLAGTAVWAVKPLSFAAYHSAYNRFLDHRGARLSTMGGE